MRQSLHRTDRQIPPVEPPPADLPDLPRWRRALPGVCLTGIVLISVALALDAIGMVRLRAAMTAARSGGEPLTYEEILARRPAAPGHPDAASVFLELQPRLAELIHVPDLARFSFRRSGWRRAMLGYRWSEEDRKAIAEALEQYRPELEQLDRLRSLPGGGLPLTITEDVISSGDPQMWEVRLGARLCALHALYAIEEGDAESLLKCTSTILSLSRLVCTHPTQAGAISSCGCDEQAVSTIERACGLAVLPAETLAALGDALAEAEHRQPLYWGLLGDRACFFEVGQLMLRTGRSPMRGVPGTGRVPGMRGLVMLDLASGLDFHNRLVAQAHDPAACMKLADEIDRQYESVPRAYWLTKGLFPRPRRLCQFALRRQVRLRAAQAGLAVERFRTEKGRFPERLAELTPAYLRDLPIDPFDGRLMRYRVDAQGALIYSSAEELNDGGWGERGFPGMPPEMGFMILPPEQRGRPATQPASAPQ